MACSSRPRRRAANFGNSKLTNPGPIRSNKRKMDYAPFPGLVNLGNTCYLNGALQILFYCPGFRHYLRCMSYTNGPTSRSIDHRVTPTEYPRRESMVDSAESRADFPGFRDNPHKNPVVETLLALYEEMDEDRERKFKQEKKNMGRRLGNDNCQTANIVPFFESVGALNKRFSNTSQQQDVQEFLRFLLGYLQDLEGEPPQFSADFSVNKENLEDFGISGNKAKNNGKKRKLDDLIENCRVLRWQKNGKRRKTQNSKKLEQETHFVKIPDLNIYPENTPSFTEKFPDLNVYPDIATNDTVEGGENFPKTKKGISFIEKLFQGNITSQIRCLKCGKISRTTDPFFDLSLSIEKGKNLEWSIQQFVAEERLEGQNSYLCSHCTSLTSAVRNLEFQNLPPVLMIHLKRFSFDKFRRKVTCHVRCPFELNLEKFCAKDFLGITSYELFAVIFHKGMSSSCGHYTALVKLSATPVGSPRPLSFSTESENSGIQFPDVPAEIDYNTSSDHDDADYSEEDSRRGTKTAGGGKKGTTARASRLRSSVRQPSSPPSPTTTSRQNIKRSRAKSVPGAYDLTGGSPPPCSTWASPTPPSSPSSPTSVEDDDRWLCFDDDEVTYVASEHVQSLLSPPSRASPNTAYILFYKQTR